MFRLTFGGLTLLLVVVLAGTLQAQQDSIADKLAEIQAMIDEEESTIATLERQLNRAVDTQQSEQIDRIRAEIQSAWDRVEKLRDLKTSLQELVGDAPPNRRGTSPRGRSAVNPERPRGGSEFGQDNSSAPTGGPVRAIPMDSERGEASRPPGDRSRPGRPNRSATAPSGPSGAFSTDGPQAAGDRARPKSPDRLEMLRRWHDDLMADGDREMADKVMDLIREEKKRLADANRDPGDGGKRGNRPRPSRSTGGSTRDQPRDPPPQSRDGKDDSRDDRGQREREMQNLIESMNEELKALRDEVRKLREQQDGDQSR